MCKLKLRAVLLILLAGNIFCLPVLAANDTQLNPYIPHTYLNGYVGDGGVGNFIGRADILAPLYITNNSDLFLYGQGFLGDKFYDGASNVWQLSAGAGYRQVIGSRIYGAYLFGDYTGTPDNNEFWMLSPGVESLGDIVDFRANGYFPMGTDKWTKESTPVFVSHETNYDLYQYYTDTESVGPGADAEVGVKVFSINHMPFKLFLDGYAFYPEDTDNILGIGGRATFQPTRYLTLEARYTYDNENHNVFVGGVRIYLNGFAYGLDSTHVDDIGIQPRLYDQIERNFAAGSVGSAATVSNKEVANGGPQPSDYYTVYVINGDTQDIATTDGVGLTGDGTLENPYIYSNTSDMQDILDATKENYPDPNTVVRIYYTSPDSTPFQMPTYTDESSYVSPYTNQQIWGTTGSDWTIPTTPDTYAVSFIGGFSLEDVSDVQFHYLSIESYPGNEFAYGLGITNSQNILLQSVSVGSITGNNGYDSAIYMENNSSITLNDVKTYAYKYGISVTNGGTITAINNSLIKGDYAGIALFANTDDNVIMGNITGDSTSTVEGGTYGLATYDQLETISSGFTSVNEVNIGDINGISFRVDSTAGDDAFHVTANGDISINSISNSNFYSASIAGLGAFSASGDVTIGDITNSSFQGVTDGFDIGGGIITIGNITGSNFTTDEDERAGLRIESSSGIIRIGDITNSTFSGYYGFEALDYTAAAATDSPSLEDPIFLSIGTVTDSTFSGSDAGIYILTESHIKVGSATDYYYGTDDPDGLYDYLSQFRFRNTFSGSSCHVSINDVCDGAGA